MSRQIFRSINTFSKLLRFLPFQNCDNVPYVLKTDDDVFVNVRNLLKFVVDNRKPNLLIGTLQCGAVPIRDPHNKWYAPKYMIEAGVYPNYLSGTAYLMSRSMAQVTIRCSICWWTGLD